MWMSPSAALPTWGLGHEFAAEFAECFPRGGSQRLGGRVGLSPQARVALVRFLADPAAQAALWPDKFACARNVLLVLCLLVTGHRVGELLSMRLTDIDLGRRLYRVVRLHNSLEDPRAVQPLSKGRERELSWPASLAGPTKAYLPQRLRRPKAAGNGFLFLASDGAPLSRSSVSKICDALKDSVPELGERFSAHVLRHTWNDLFSEAADRAQLSPEVEVRARMMAMGWKSRATAETYTRRSDAKAVEDVSTMIQDELFGSSGGRR